MRVAGIKITVDGSWVFLFVLLVFSLGGGYLP